jgi:hypothetical protein
MGTAVAGHRRQSLQTEPPSWSWEAALRDPQRRTSLVVAGEEAKEFLQVRERFTSLRILELQGDLARLLKRLFGLARLREVRASCAGLVALPEAVGDLKGLRTLVLDNNELRRLPRAIGRLTRLETLEVSCNKIERLPGELFACRSVRFLGLSGNRLGDFPGAVGRLTRLEWLSVNANALRRCPPEVGRLRRLRTLMLSENRLVEVPETIGRLKELKELCVGGNPLSEECRDWLRGTFGRRPRAILYDLD